MQPLRFNTTDFISEYMQAKDAGLTSQELADLMGISYSCFYCRKHALKKRGVRLPSLKRKSGSGRKPVRRAARLIAPVECVIEPAPLTFTMDVGVFDA